MVKVKKQCKGFEVKFTLRGKRASASPTGKPMTKSKAKDLIKRMKGVGLNPRLVKSCK